MTSVKLLRYPRPSLRENYGIANDPTANCLTYENTSLSRLSPALPRAHHEYTARLYGVKLHDQSMDFSVGCPNLRYLLSFFRIREKTFFGFHVFPIIPGGIPILNESLLLLPTQRHTHLSLISRAYGIQLRRRSESVNFLTSTL